MSNLELYGPILVAATIILFGTIVAAGSGRFGVPTLVVYLVVGFILGSDVTGLIPFDDAGIAQTIGVIALAVILFEGGLQTPPERIRPVIRPVLVLASVGVVITALVAAAISYYIIGLPGLQSLLLGAIVGSTDAAAVFASLRNRPLKARVAQLVEGESGANDPMAIFLMLLVLETITGDAQGIGAAIVFLAMQFGIGAAAGFVGAKAAAWLVRHMSFETSGLYPLAMLAAAFTVFGATAVIGGSGFLAVYLMGVLLAGQRLPYEGTVLRFHEGLAWMMQISMFVILGLLAFPSAVLAEAWYGLALTVGLLFVARPLAVFALLPKDFDRAERTFVSWAGLRGAVPIILATYPLMAGIDDADRIFNLVVFVVVGSALLQGATLSMVAGRLGLLSEPQRQRKINIELETAIDLDANLTAYTVHPGSEADGVTLAELGLPPGAVVSAVVRDSNVLSPQGRLQLRGDDTAFVLVTEPHAAAQVEALLGAPA